MKKHLNLFYSYSQGGFENIDEERILEDNVTRALITTLKYSEPSLTEAFLSNILEYDTKHKNFDFELQNIDDNDSLDLVHHATKKFVLGISPSGQDPFENRLAQIPEHVMVALEDFVKEQTDLNSKTDKKHLKEMRKDIRDIVVKIRNTKKEGSSQKKDFINVIGKFLPQIKEERDWRSDINDIDLLDQITYIYQSLLGSRPDGWIWEKGSQSNAPEFAVLIENKISGELNRTQIERHIKRDTGFNSTIASVKRKVVSWKHIYKFFKEQSNEEPKNITDLLVNQFVKYLEENDMGDFAGFSLEDFTLLDRQKTWKRMKMIGDDYILKNLDDRGWGKNFKPNPKRKDRFDQQGTKGELKVYLGSGDIKRYCKFTFCLNKDFHLDIAFPSNKEDHKILVNKILTRISEFKKIIENQKFSYELMVYAKYKKLNKTGNYAPNKEQQFYEYCRYKTKYDENEYYNILQEYNLSKETKFSQSEIYSNKWLDHLLQELKYITNPFITYNKEFPATFVVNQKEHFQELLWQVTKDLYPMYEFLISI